MWKKLASIYESRSRSLAILYDFRSAGEAAEIVTPFLDPFNERIIVRVREEGDQYLLCDRGLATRIVERAGRADGREILGEVCRDFDLSQSGDHLYVRTSEAGLLARQFRLCNALVALGDRLRTLPPR